MQNKKRCLFFLSHSTLTNVALIATQNWADYEVFLEQVKSFWLQINWSVYYFFFFANLYIFSNCKFMQPNNIKVHVYKFYFFQIIVVGNYFY